ncbi:efflux RND transporter periplasmic adaptor subunit [Marinobacterium sediminicola]|nr:efflux RND transporter periplasmic adaptor subunit [Marinobacterium sediminicola]ULG70372.1 efflux RND transporter periplasmic adaptor subunit [Marinobacterium sediminicola]
MRFVRLILLLALPLPAAAQSEYALDQGELRAQLSPARYAMLSAELGGKIDQSPVREGERVEQGQLLIKFDCALQAAQLQKARAQLAGALNTYKGSQRMAELNAIGSVELNNSKVEVDKARADVAYLDATVQRCSLKAPYAGVIGEKKVREQEFVQAGQPLLEIIDDSALELEFIVPSRWLSWLVPGYAFEVSIEDTGRTYPVKLAYTAAKVDPLSQSVKAVAVIDGHYGELLAGMSGRLLLTPPQP